MYAVLHYSHQFKWCDICHIFVAVTDTVFSTHHANYAVLPQMTWASSWT